MTHKLCTYIKRASYINDIYVCCAVRCANQALHILARTTTTTAVASNHITYTLCIAMMRNTEIKRIVIRFIMKIDAGKRGCMWRGWKRAGVRKVDGRTWIGDENVSWKQAIERPFADLSHAGLLRDWYKHFSVSTYTHTSLQRNAKRNPIDTKCWDLSLFAIFVFIFILDRDELFVDARVHS